MYFLFYLILISAMCIHGAKLKLKGSVYSKATSKDMPGTLVEILSQDSTVLAKDTAFYVDWNYDRNSATYREDTLARYTLEIEKAPGNYIVRVTKEGYETRYMDYPLADLQSREFERKVPKIYISPESKATTLGELTVKATKIKFYNKGDTIVYNADAFNLPEGSMLDALIEQMPGVEIKDGGKIYVNGRYVESLLLNGKDFFKGNKDVMLENIGVYTVKDVAVYEKKGELSKLLETEMQDDMEYVMDVRLKKEYQVGTLANFEVGGGTKDRWLGRLFAMRNGYIDDSLNDTRFLLSPGVKYKIRNWTFALNANDVLNQMQNISYVVDAQARTQTLTSILPRHIMLSVKYSFDLKPGKKKAAPKE